MRHHCHTAIPAARASAAAAAADRKPLGGEARRQATQATPPSNHAQSSKAPAKRERPTG
jgi:hypothetical protein